MDPSLKEAQNVSKKDTRPRSAMASPNLAGISPRLHGNTKGKIDSYSEAKFTATLALHHQLYSRLRFVLKVSIREHPGSVPGRLKPVVHCLSQKLQGRSPHGFIAE